MERGAGRINEDAHGDGGERIVREVEEPTAKPVVFPAELIVFLAELVGFPAELIMFLAALVGFSGINP